MASLKSEHPGGNLSETWLWHTGGTVWISDTWRSSRCSAPPTTGPSLQAALLIQSVETVYPSGGSSKWLPNTHTCLTLHCMRLPRANHLKLRVQLDAQSEAVNCPFPSSGPEETDLWAEGMAEVAHVFGPASHPQLTGKMESLSLD